MYLPVKVFSEKYNLAPNRVYSLRSNGELPESIFKFEKVTGVLLIEEDYFIRRKNFIRRVWLQSHDNFYFLTLSISEFKLANILASLSSHSVGTWTMFLHSNLFMLPLNGITITKVHNLAWKFFRLSSFIIHRLFRKKNIPRQDRDIKRILYASK